MNDQENQPGEVLNSDGQPVGRQLRDGLTQYLGEVLAESDVSEQDRPLLAEALLQDALRQKATDIHIDSQSDGILVRLRIDGRLLDCMLLPDDVGTRIVNQFKALARLSSERGLLPEESRISYVLDKDFLDLRLAYAPTINGQKLSIRVLQFSKTSMQLQELGLDEAGLDGVEGWIDNVSGILLVVGPTGSGKTTTLYSLLHKLKSHERNVVTIEDPVEYQIDGITQIQVHLKQGLDYAAGMKSMLRLDPDYLMLGEIRDAASANAAVTAATSGHALMGTLHSRDAVGAIDTLRSYGLSGQDISATLVLVISQRLVRKLCPDCKVEAEPDAGQRAWIKSLKRKVPEKVWQAGGCDKCRNLGYSGRTGIFEVWRIGSMEYQLLLEEADRGTIISALQDNNHRFLIDDGLRKVADGVTSLSELRSFSASSTIPDFDVGC